MTKSAEPTFSAFQADKFYYILNADRLTFAVAQPGDWIIWDKFMTLAVMSDEDYQSMKSIIKPKDGR